jgi:hypothetical protein
MKTNFKTIVTVMFVVMIFTFACIDSAPKSVTKEATAAPESHTAPTQQPPAKEGKVEITSSNSYLDSFSDYNVVGEVINNTDHTVENVTLSLAITDESGASLLKDDNDNLVDRLDIQPDITVLGPGISAPFHYYISADDVKPAKFDVTIKSYDQSSAAKLERFDVQNVQITAVGNDIVLAGEVINLSSDSVDVETLAGALLDKNDKVLAADSTLTYSRYLYPAGDSAGRDRGPFVVKFYGPLENIDQWKVYVRSIENTTTPPPDIDVSLTGSYVDSSGTYHLLGKVTNNGSAQISPSVIGGLYNADKTMFDAASSNIPLYLKTGESAPFDLNTFEVVNSLPSEQASPADKIVQPDLYWTFTSNHQVISLEAKNVNVKQDGSSWEVTGRVSNTSGQKLSSINVVITFLDGDQQIIATNSTAIYPPDGSDTVEAGTSNEFSIPINVPEDLDLSSQDYQIILQGVVAQ